MAIYTRYIYLITSVAASAGIVVSQLNPTPSSLLARTGVFQDVLWFVLWAWLAVSVCALVTKLVHWRDYSASSPFASPAARKVVRVASPAVMVVAALFALDRLGIGAIDLCRAATSATSNPDGFLPSVIYMAWTSRDLFARGVGTTIALAVFGTIIAFVLALGMVFLRIQSCDRNDNDFVRFCKVVASGFTMFYSTVVRGTPMMVQAMIIFFGVFGLFKMTNLTTTQINAIWSTFTAGLVTIVLNSTAYMMEVLRGGIESVDAGQTEAARSLGLSQWEAMRTVVFPQGVKFAIPGLSNELVINIKDSSVLSVIGTFDLMFATTTVGGIYYAKFEAALVTSVIYLCLTMFASWLLGRLANRLNVKSVKLGSASNQPVNVEER